MLFNRKRLNLVEGERQAMRNACKFNASLLDLVRQNLRPGLTTDEIDQLIASRTAEAGHKSASLGYMAQQSSPFPKSCCTSVNDVICHGVPGPYALKDGDIVNVDLTTIVNGWHGDSSETFIVGTPSDLARRVVQCAHDALWAAIDPGGMRQYPQTVRLLNDVQRWKSYSVQSLFITLHVPALTSELVAGAAGVAAIAALVLLRRRGDDATFSAAVVSGLIATPILWNHYLVLLLAPIAIVRPRLAPLWLLPLVLWATPHPESLGVVWRIVLVLAVIGVVAVQAVRRSSQRSLTEGLAGFAPSGADAPPRPV